MRILTMLLILGLVFSSAAAFRSDVQQKATLLFGFGDSYADTGNQLKSGNVPGHGWLYPYGITWPQQPAGRISDGKIQTDLFADLLDLSYPPPYLYSFGEDISSGVNFAVGGARATTLDAQIDKFELLLRTGPYSEAALASSLTLVSICGNDYLFTANATTEFPESVVWEIQANLQRLYNLGLRNVMVSNQHQFDCLPLITKTNGYTRCTNTSCPLVHVHNTLLLGAVQNINTRNPGARFIILDQYSAFNRLIEEAPALGFTDRLKPCCKGTVCSILISATPHEKPLSTLCMDRGKAIFWDDAHLTMSAWHYMVNLYVNEPGYILLADASTLKRWLQMKDVVQVEGDTTLAAGREEQQHQEGIDWSGC